MNVNPDQVANRRRSPGFEKLQLGRGLRDKIQRHHEKQKRDGEKQYARDRSSPAVKNEAEKEKQQGGQGEPCLNSACPGKKQEQSKRDEQPAPPRRTDGGVPQFVALPPNDKRGDGQNERGVFVIGLRAPRPPSPHGGGFRAD